MNSKNFTRTSLLAAWAMFAFVATAQQPAPSQPSPAPESPAGSMPHEMMDPHHMMMMHHSEMGNLINRLVNEFSALENEKDPVALKKKMDDYRALLGELQTRFQEGDGMMGMQGPMSQHPISMQHAEQAMGFSQTATTHHFLLKNDGGVIQVEANDPNDAHNRDLIRTHLTHIAHAFSAGDFSDPMAVHDKVPDGVPVMQRLKADIRYTFDQTPQGGRVSIQTANPQALDAIHDFLRFQIEEHQTGDSLNVQ